MNKHNLKPKMKEWLHRYIPAEVLSTTLALAAAWIVFRHNHSYAAAAATGWTAEGFGFYGYFVTSELLSHASRYQEHHFVKRVSLAISKASTNLIVEFMPAEIIDGFFVRPLAMYAFPRFIHPYPIGFLAGKLSADVLFYLLSIVGYEARKRWLH